MYYGTKVANLHKLHMLYFVLLFNKVRPRQTTTASAALSYQHERGPCMIYIVELQFKPITGQTALVCKPWSAKLMLFFLKFCCYI